MKEPAGYYLNGSGFRFFYFEENKAKTDHQAYGGSLRKVYFEGEDPEIKRMLDTAAMYQKLYNDARQTGKVYILWQAWDSWQIHSIYLNREAAEEKKESLMKSEAPYCYMGYQIEEKVVN